MRITRAGTIEFDEAIAAAAAAIAIVVAVATIAIVAAVAGDTNITTVIAPGILIIITLASMIDVNFVGPVILVH